MTSVPIKIEDCWLTFGECCQLAGKTHRRFRQIRLAGLLRSHNRRVQPVEANTCLEKLWPNVPRMTPEQFMEWRGRNAGF